MNEAWATLMLVGGFVVIGGFVVGMKVRGRRAFEAGHGVLMDAWAAVASDLRLGWVVPEAHTRDNKRPPALHGKHDGRSVYVGLVDSAVDEDLTPKWQALVTVSLRHEVANRRDRRRVLKSLKKGKRASADLKKRELRVLRSGRWKDAAALTALVREVSAGADALERLGTG